MNKHIFVTLIPLVLLLGVFVAGIAVHPAHALTGGSPIVCIVDPGSVSASPITNGCPTGASAFTGPPTTDVTSGKAQLRVNIDMNNTLPSNGFDIQLVTDPTVLKPFDVDLTTDTVGLAGDTPTTLCIGGNSIIGSCGSQSNNVLGSLELGLGGTAFTPANATGVLFTAIYDIVGNVAAGTTTIGFQTGCSSASSMPPTCITLTSGGSANNPVAAALTATYATSATAVTPFWTFSSTTTTAVQVVKGGSSPAISVSINAFNAFTCNGAGCISVVSKAAPAIGQPTTSGVTLSISPAGPYCDASCLGVPPSSFTVTMTTSSAVQLGTYFLTVEGVVSATPAPGVFYLSSSITFTVHVVDYSVSLSPTSMTLIQGSPAKTDSSVITVTSLGGAVGTVTLTCSAGCAPGVAGDPTAAFNATSVVLAANGVKHSKVTLTPGTVAGAITVTIRGSLAGVLRPANIAVTVLVATDYYLNSTSASVSGLAGATITTGINVVGGSSSTGTVALSVASITPATGLSCLLTPTSEPLPAGGTSSLQCNGSGGVYSVVVNGVNGATTHSTTVTVTVQDFTLSSNAPSTTGIPNQDLTVGINAQGQNGFTGTIDVVSNATGAISCFYMPPSMTIPPTIASTLLHCTASVGGSYLIRTTGTDHGTSLSHTVDVTFIIQDFSITANPPSVTTNTGPPGGSSTLTVASIQHYGAPNGVAVDLSPTAPTGISCSLSKTRVFLNDNSSTSVLTCQSTSTFTNAKVNVTATSGSLPSRTVTVLYTIGAQFDYSLSNNGPTSIQQGSSGTVTVTATLKSGTATSVTLSCVTPLPTGITCTSFNPPSVTPSTSGVSSILTIAVASSVAPGSYTIMVTGAPLGATTTPTTVSITVTPIPFDYSLSNNGPVSIQQGSSGTVTITATLKSGTSQSVTLSCVTPLPSGITCTSFNPPSVTPSSTGSTSILTIAVASSVVPGSYSVQVTGAPLGATTTPTTVSITVTSVPFDYSLSNNSPVSIQQGSSGTVTITATLRAGAAQSVTLSCVTPLPSGITCTSFNPPSVTPSSTGATSILTIAVASSVVPGSYSVPVTGTPLGATTTPTTVSITVTSVPFDYSLSNNGPVSIQQGSSGTVTITATLSAGTSQSVTLSCVTPLPTGITCTSFNPPSVTPSSTGATSILTIAVASSVAPGSYSIQVTGAPLGATTTPTTVSITVTSVPFDYSLSNNGPVSIQQGSSGTVTITATLKAGIAQSVTLSCVTPLPSGITCTSFNPTSVTPSSTGATSVLTIAVASSVVPGSYSIQVTGAPLGATTTPTTVSITVTSVPFDYSLSNNGPVSIQQGSSGTVTITATLKAGVAQSVTLSCVTPLPSGITCMSFNPPSVTPSSTGASSVLTIAVASSVSTGSQTIQVTGTPLGVTTTPTTVSITVTSVPFDYSLSNNGPVSIQQGSSGTVTITATLKAGSAQSVTLSCVTPLPSGVTCTSFNPPSVTPSSTGAASVLTIAVASSVAAGSQTIQVTGSPLGATTTPTTVSITVTSVPFDYSLSNNGPVSIQQGSSGTVTITATLKSGTGQSVTLSCVTPLPSAITCTSFNPPSVTPSSTGATSILTIAVASSVAPGSYSVQVTGAPLGSTTTPTTVSITVTSVPFDYSLSNNGPVSIQQGSSGTVSITATLTAGVAQSVTLSCVTPLPSGITCTSFNPPSVTPSSTGATSVLTIAVASSVAPGSYSIQVTGTPLGANTAPTTVSITVTAVPFDYSLSNNGPVSIQQGSSGTVTITASLISGAAQSVALSCVTPLPTGITCTSFNPPSVTPSSTGGTSILTIAVASSVAPGSYSIQVTGAPLGATTTPTTVSITVSSVPFDYSLSNNGPVSIQQGSSGTVIITATLKAGTAESVTLSCVTPLPSGITCTSFNPPSVTPSSTGATSILSIAVASTVTPGSYSVQVTGAPLGATTTPTVVSIAVTSAPFDYSLSNNGPVSIQQGSSGTVLITATLTSGTSQSVTLSCVTPLPSGITCTSFNPPSVTPSSSGASSVLTISVASSVAAGPYSVQVNSTPLGATTTPTTVSISVTSVFTHPTQTNVTCSPGSVVVNTPTTCTARVIDTSEGPTVPTGTVSFTTNSTGTFSSSSTCALSPGNSPGMATCTVSYTPTVTGHHNVTGTYSGDSAHQTSLGSFVVNARSAKVKTTLSFSAFDMDDFDNGVGQLQVFVNGAQVVDIPAGLNSLTGTGDFDAYHATWVNFGPFDITNYVVDGQNSVTFTDLDPANHFGIVSNVEVDQTSTVLLHVQRFAGIDSTDPLSVTYTFSNPPLVLASFTPSNTTPAAGQSITFTATYTGGTGPFRCIFRFGDGSSAIANGVNGTCTTTHTYNSSGAFSARVIIIGQSTSDRVSGTFLLTVAAQQA